MRPVRFLPASLLAAALAIAFAAPAFANIVVAIDKSTQSMSVSVDGAPRYTWAVSTGRPGYDTPNGTFKPNRMDADHLSQEWDNAPMPHTIFFDMSGHAIHGFFDVKHLGSPVSHGCVRLSPDHATTLFDLVKAEGMSNTTVTVSGHTPAGTSPEIARRRAPEEATAYGPPMQIVPDYGQQAPAPYDAQSYYRQAQPAYRPPQPYYAQQLPYYGQAQQPYYGQQQPYYGQPAAQPQYYGPRPYNQY